MSVPHFKFTGGALKLRGARKMIFEVEPVAPPTLPPAKEPVAVLVEPPPSLKVEPPAEVAETSTETGLVPENPPTE